MNEFDSKARDWDNNIRHVDRAKSVAGSIKSAIPLNKDLRALEYGAGTGLLSMELKDSLKSIVLMDSSEGMINVTSSKIKSAGVNNLTTVLWDLEKEVYQDSFDLIYTLMVLHHVSDIDIIINRFYCMLNSGGSIAIADLYTEDGSFHGDNFKGFYGFDPDVIGKTLISKGFHNVKHEKCYNIRKTILTGEVKDFPVFLLTAKKN